MKAELAPNLNEVMTVLSGDAKALSAYDILEKLKRTPIRHPPTVYRALDKLRELGLVHRLDSVNGYVACSHHHHGDGCAHGHAHAAHFAICTGCGKVEEIESKPLTQAIQRIGSQYFQTTERATLEISGICFDCADKKTGGKEKA